MFGGHNLSKSECLIGVSPTLEQDTDANEGPLTTARQGETSVDRSSGVASDYHFQQISFQGHKQTLPYTHHQEVQVASGDLRLRPAQEGGVREPGTGTWWMGEVDGERDEVEPTSSSTHVCGGVAMQVCKVVQLLEGMPSSK